MQRSNAHLNLALLCLLLLTCSPYVSLSLFSTTYHVGPNQQYSSILQVPTHNLQPGDSLLVYAKPTPYHEKFLLHGVGTAAQPIHVIGIPDVNGALPILDGDNATSSTAYNYFNENRQVVLIGQYGVFESDYLILDGFEIRQANNFNNFTNDQGNTAAYQANAAGVRVSWGRNITIRNCDIHHNGNGIQNGEGVGQNLVIEYCRIYDNGRCTWVNSFIHNFYLNSGTSSTVTIQYCHVGELLSNGQQVRSRAEKTVIRYNWIEGGRNSSLDLMQDIDSFHVYISDAWVYGNVIVKPDSSENARMIHFGTDGANSFRRGTLHFFNNTCIVKDARTWGTKRVFALSSDSCLVIADNNIFYKPSGSIYELFDGSPVLSGSNNWISTNINGTGGLSNSLSGTQPGFFDPAGEDYRLKCSSVCHDAVPGYSPPAGHPLLSQYVPHTQVQPRPVSGALDIGAFETPLSPAVFLGNDTSISSSASLLLNAGAGHTAYLWQDGSSNPTFNVTSPPYPLGIHLFHVTVTDSNACSNSDSIQVTILPPTGMPDPAVNWQVFPNPTQGRLTFERPSGTGDITLTVRSVDGKLHRRQGVSGSRMTIDLSGLPKGVYLLEIADAGARQTYRILLQ